MLTEQDIQRLVTVFSKIFATKDDLKNFATKSDLKKELEKYATKEDIEDLFVYMQGAFKELKNDIKEVDTKVTDLRKEVSLVVNRHEQTLYDHGRRINNLEETCL